MAGSTLNNSRNISNSIFCLSSKKTSFFDMKKALLCTIQPSNLKNNSFCITENEQPIAGYSKKEEFTSLSLAAYTLKSAKDYFCLQDVLTTTTTLPIEWVVTNTSIEESAQPSWARFVEDNSSAIDLKNENLEVAGSAFSSLSLLPLTHSASSISFPIALSEASGPNPFFYKKSKQKNSR